MNKDKSFFSIWKAKNHSIYKETNIRGSFIANLYQLHIGESTPQKQPLQNSLTIWDGTFQKEEERPTNKYMTSRKYTSDNWCGNS
jgi:hypothetical protein